MNKFQFVQSMFPLGTVRKGDAMEVNGLPKGTEPQGVEIIGRFQDAEYADRGERREFFLVRNDEFFALFRICTAMEGSGYDEYVAIHHLDRCKNAQALNAANHTFIRWGGVLPRRTLQ